MDANEETLTGGDDREKLGGIAWWQCLNKDSAARVDLGLKLGEIWM